MALGAEITRSISRSATLVHACCPGPCTDAMHHVSEPWASALAGTARDQCAAAAAGAVGVRGRGGGRGGMLGSAVARQAPPLPRSSQHPRRQPHLAGLPQKLWQALFRLGGYARPNARDTRRFGAA
eukprot:3471075-Rhodomonas_salina.1